MIHNKASVMYLYKLTNAQSVLYTICLICAVRCICRCLKLLYLKDMDIAFLIQDFEHCYAAPQKVKKFKSKQHVTEYIITQQLLTLYRQLSRSDQGPYSSHDVTITSNYTQNLQTAHNLTLPAYYNPHNNTENQ